MKNQKRDGMKKSKLLKAFADREIIEVSGVRMMISSIEHEDGSGFSFNVTGYPVGLGHWHVKVTVYVRTTK